MNRIRIILAFVIILMGLVSAAVWLQVSGTLASKSFRWGRSSVHLRLYQRDGAVGIRAHQTRGWNGGVGWMQDSRLGDVAEVGTGGAKISDTAHPGVFQFQVGRVSGTFDANSRSISVDR